MDPRNTIEIGGKQYMADAKANLVPVEAIKPADLLMDETVHKITGFARDLSAQIARFKGHTFEDVNGLQALIAQVYGVTVGGRKRSEEHTSELQSLMRIFYAVFFLKKKN